MATTFFCQHCNEPKPANHRLKGHQSYCDAPKCQRARKAAWQKSKMATDPAYRTQQTEALHDWQKEWPLHQYQKEYRDSHPEYVQRNRELQKNRNQKRSSRLACLKIVKMDAFQNPTPEKSTSYIMNPYKLDASGKIVKMDSLVVQLVNLQEPINRALLLNG
jgi:hypothetical protein